MNVSKTLQLWLRTVTSRKKGSLQICHLNKLGLQKQMLTQSWDCSWPYLIGCVSRERHTLFIRQWTPTCWPNINIICILTKTKRLLVYSCSHFILYVYVLLLCVWGAAPYILHLTRGQLWRRDIAGALMIAGTPVWSSAPPVYISKCPWARHFTPNYLQLVSGSTWPSLAWQLAGHRCQLVYECMSVWLDGWMRGNFIAYWFSALDAMMAV